jgi:hypothetical protein
LKDSIRTTVVAKVSSGLGEVSHRLSEVAKHLINGEDLAALGAISGLSERIQYIETLLTVMRDLQAHQDSIQGGTKNAP